LPPLREITLPEIERQGTRTL